MWEDCVDVVKVLLFGEMGDGMECRDVDLIDEVFLWLDIFRCWFWYLICCLIKLRLLICNSFFRNWYEVWILLLVYWFILKVIWVDEWVSLGIEVLGMIELFVNVYWRCLLMSGLYFVEVVVNNNVVKCRYCVVDRFLVGMLFVGLNCSCFLIVINVWWI